LQAFSLTRNLFNQYQQKVPEIEVLVLAEGGKIKGVGEPGVPPFAPALANAIFQPRVNGFVKCLLI